MLIFFCYSLVISLYVAKLGLLNDNVLILYEGKLHNVSSSGFNFEILEIFSRNTVKHLSVATFSSNTVLFLSHIYLIHISHNIRI